MWLVKPEARPEAEPKKQTANQRETTPDKGSGRSRKRPYGPQFFWFPSPKTLALFFFVLTLVSCPFAVASFPMGGSSARRHSSMSKSPALVY